MTINLEYCQIFEFTIAEDVFYSFLAMKISLWKLAPVGVALSVLGLTFSQAAHAATLIKQEFRGTFTLLSASPLLQDTLPKSSEYSGFVAYEEGGVLSDWEIDVTELDLSLSSDSNSGEVPDPPFDGGFGLDPLESPDINFELFSLSNWELTIDFGIIFDAPRYTLTRNRSEVTFNVEAGSVGGYVYRDRATTITLSQSGTVVPEPGTILGLLAMGGLGLAVRSKGKPTA